MWVLRREFRVSCFVWLVHLPPLLIPVFTAELCDFLPLVPLVIYIGTEPGFCFPSSLHTSVSPATGSSKGKSWFFTLHFLWFAAAQGRPSKAGSAQPSLLCLQLGLWFFLSSPFLLLGGFFVCLLFVLGFCCCFYGCSEVFKELLTAHGKLSKHSTQPTCLPLLSFPVPPLFLLGVVEKPRFSGFGWAACAAFRQHAGLDLPALTAAEASWNSISAASSPAFYSCDCFHWFLIRNLLFSQLYKPCPIACSFPWFPFSPRLSRQLIPLFQLSCFIFMASTGYLFLLSLVLRFLGSAPAADTWGCWFWLWIPEVRCF